MILSLVIAGFVVVGVGIILLVRGLASARGLFHAWGIKVDVPVAVFVLALGALMLVGGYFGRDIFPPGGGPRPTITVPPPDSPPKPTTTTTTTPPPTTTPIPPPRATASFTKPTPGSSIHAAQNVVVSGSVSGLPPGTTLWMVYTASNGGPDYYLISNRPVLNSDGSWNFTDTEVGDASDIGGTITYHAIQADTACNQALVDAAAKDGDPPTALPPPTCVEAGSVEVKVVA